MTAAHPPSAALAAGSELTSPDHAVKIDAVLLARSLGQRVLPGGGRAGQRTTPRFIFLTFTPLSANW